MLSWCCWLDKFIIHILCYSVWVWNNCIGRNLWLCEHFVPIDDENDKECVILENTHHRPFIRNTMPYIIWTVSNITLENMWQQKLLSGCVWNLIFSADENESEIQFSIFLMHFTLPRTHTHKHNATRTNAHCVVVKWFFTCQWVAYGYYMPIMYSNRDSILMGYACKYTHNFAVHVETI